MESAVRAIEIVDKLAVQIELAGVSRCFVTVGANQLPRLDFAVLDFDAYLEVQHASIKAVLSADVKRLFDTLKSVRDRSRGHFRL